MRISDWSSDVCSSDLTRFRISPSDQPPRSPGRTRHRERLDPGPSQRVRAAYRDVRPLVRVSHVFRLAGGRQLHVLRSEEHTSELQSLMRISYAVFCLHKKKISYMNIHHL